jgi:hypothetical protein
MKTFLDLAVLGKPEALGNFFLSSVWRHSHARHRAVRSGSCCKRSVKLQSDLCC